MNCTSDSMTISQIPVFRCETAEKGRAFMEMQNISTDTEFSSVCFKMLSFYATEYPRDLLAL